jgi:hypothetical protein
MHTVDVLFGDVAPEQRQFVIGRYPTERGTGAEAQDVKRRLAGFDASRSPIGRLLRDKFPDATKNELISVAQMTIFVAKERFPQLPPNFDKFDRVTRRSKDLIIKWYHDHWSFVHGLFPDIGLADGNFQIISKDTIPGGTGAL